MNHFLRKIGSTGLFIEDCFWDNSAYPETVGVPKMTAGSPAVPAIPAQDAVAGVQMHIGGEPVTDKEGNPAWITPPKDAVQAVAEVPEVKSMQELDEQGNPAWITAPVPAFAGNPIPADLIATPVPGGFGWPKWDGTKWSEGKNEKEPS
jgi:hypothetical protein